ncbi:MAG: helix-turn-helix domain-containing protein, partial [Halobacteriales archaeon]|nr:helix-turn-helix domain-containing protein [Halobacteriales archaeon]
MTRNSPNQTAVELLQQLGLKPYEAKSFVALTQLPSGTARSISEQVDVPRTRVYRDAARVPRGLTPRVNR